MFNLFANMLAWFYELVPNYAVAIGLFTLTVMIVLTPLTLKGTKGMLELQRLQPEIKRLQAQHKGDRQKLNEEMMRLYQEHKVNPLGGCLPLLLQAPIFIILFRVLRGLTHVGPDGTFDPKYLNHDTALYKALDGSTEMIAFGIDLSRRATEVIRESFVDGLPYLVLVLLVAATSYIQQWQITRRNPAASINQQQQMIMKLMPVIFAVISISLPAGLIFYFLVSNTYRIGQQAYITRKFYRGEAAAERAAALEAANKEASGKDGGKKKALPSAKDGPKSAGSPKAAARPPQKPPKPVPPSAKRPPSGAKPPPAEKPAPPASAKPTPRKPAPAPKSSAPKERPTPSRPAKPASPPPNGSTPNPPRSRPTPSRPPKQT